MNTKKIALISTSICIAFLVLISCVKDVDFNQTKDLKIEPVYELDFVYSRIETAKFTNPVGGFMPVLRDTLQDEFFSGDVGDKLLKAELFVSLENSIPVGFDAELQFLDGNDNVIPISISPITITVPAGNLGNEQRVEQTYSFILQDFELLQSAEKLASSVTIEGNDNDLDGELILKSKAIYYTSLLDE